MILVAYRMQVALAKFSENDSEKVFVECTAVATTAYEDGNCSATNRLRTRSSRYLTTNFGL